MYPLNAFIAGALSMWLWPLPEFDYFQFWMSQHVGRINGIPKVGGW